MEHENCRHADNPAMFSFAPHTILSICFPSSSCFHTISIRCWTLHCTTNPMWISPLFLLVAIKAHTFPQNHLEFLPFVSFLFSRWFEQNWRKPCYTRNNWKSLFSLMIITQQLCECLWYMDTLFVRSFFCCSYLTTQCAAEWCDCVLNAKAFPFELSMFNHRNVSCAYSDPICLSRSFAQAHIHTQFMLTNTGIRYLSPSSCCSLVYTAEFWCERVCVYVFYPTAALLYACVLTSCAFGRNGKNSNSNINNKTVECYCET